jgi:hypothetical protein
MRSELVFGAMSQVPHRLLLVRLASKANHIYRVGRLTTTFDGYESQEK